MSIRRLPEKPPEPTLDRPLRQVEWVWKKYLMIIPNGNTREKSELTLREYLYFLREHHGDDPRLGNDPRFFLRVHWDAGTLLRAWNHWKTRGTRHTAQLAASSLRMYVSALKAVVRFTAALGLAAVADPNDFLAPATAHGQRQTQRYAAYSSDEIERIRRWLAPEVDYARRVAAGYQRTGQGADPRGAHRSREAPWSTWDNVVWYFEHVLLCDPRNFDRTRNIDFNDAVKRHHGGRAAVWRRLGVARRYGAFLVGPVAVKLALETGLNSESLLGLRRDGYREHHDLFGAPYLAYVKVRSGGEKELPLERLDRPAGAPEGSASEGKMLLHRNQAVIIRRTIDLALALTEPLVPRAPAQDASYLFLYEDQAGQVRRLTTGILKNYLRRQKKEHPELSQIEYLNVARFRTTLASEMVRQGYDLFALQGVLGHQSARTSAGYFSGLEAGHPLQNALVQIRNNIRAQREAPKSYASEAMIGDPAVLYQGPFCDCKDPFHPPAHIAKQTRWVAGTPCGRADQCLFCESLVVTREHLPKLLVYDLEITLALDIGHLRDTPQGPLYERRQQALAVIFEAFGEEDLTWAKKLALVNIDRYYLDSVTHRTVENAWRR